MRESCAFPFSLPLVRACVRATRAMQASNSTAGPPPFVIDLSWEKSWPLYTVYPLSTAFFVSMYFVGPKFWPKVVPRYAKMSPLNQQCFRQNTNSLLHAVVVTILMFSAVVTDPVMMTSRPLHPYHNDLGYVGLSWSLAHFTWTIPWSYRLYFCKGERHATNLPLCIHHAIVFIAAVTFLITRTCALYGAVAYAAMEFTNVFFVPHILQQQLRSKWKKVWNANYIVLVVMFVALRLGLCTWLAVLFTQDLTSFQSSSGGEWFSVLLQFTIFWAVTLLSWVWLYQGAAELGLVGKLRKICKVGGSSSSTFTSANGSTRPGPAKPGKAVRSVPSDRSSGARAPPANSL